MEEPIPVRIDPHDPSAVRPIFDAYIGWLRWGAARQALLWLTAGCGVTLALFFARPGLIALSGRALALVTAALSTSTTAARLCEWRYHRHLVRLTSQARPGPGVRGG